jgi:hypothetical protein
MASIALVLPLELGNPSFFGNDLQLVLGCVAFRFESAGIAIVVARAGGVGRPRRIARHGRSCGWSKGRIPLDELENTKKIVRDKRGSKRGLRRSRRSSPPTSTGTN